MRRSAVLNGVTRPLWSLGTLRGHLKEMNERMKEKEARELLAELFERHSVPSIPVKFHPATKTTKGEDIPKLKEIGLGHLAAAVTVVTKGEFHVDPVTRERWIEFYGLPSATIVRHEFKHYLNLLDVEYIRKKPVRPDLVQCPWRCPLCGGRCGGWDGHGHEHECPDSDHPRVKVGGEK